MKKEEILEKSRKTGVDERVNYVEDRALTIGGWAVTISIGLYMLIRAIYSLEIYDLLSILSAYLMVNYIYKFYQMRKVKLLIVGIVFALATIIYGVIYIISLGR